MAETTQEPRTETIRLNDGTELKGNVILSGDLFLYVTDSSLRGVFAALIEPERTAQIIYTQINGEEIVFSGYRKLISVRDEGMNLITAVLRKE